jgi:hypothetical protein
MFHKLPYLKLPIPKHRDLRITIHEVKIIPGEHIPKCRTGLLNIATLPLSEPSYNFAII